MGYWANCACCGKEIGYEDYRSHFGDAEEIYCYDCTQDILEVIEKYCKKRLKKLKGE